VAPKFQQQIKLTIPKDRRPRQMTLSELEAFCAAARTAGLGDDHGTCARVSAFGYRVYELWADTGEAPGAV
jgi:hypothetical protein